MPVAIENRVRLLLWIGFGGLLLLIAIIGLSAISFLYQIEIRQQRIQQDYVERDRKLETLRSAIYLSGTYVRDFLLDRDESRAEAHKQSFLATRQQVLESLGDYRKLVAEPDLAHFEEFSKELNSYLAVLSPSLSWDAEARRVRGYDFIREQVLPRRMGMIALADRIQQMSQRQLEASSRDVSDLFSGFRIKLLVMFLLAGAVGIALAGGILRRIFQLENESQIRFQEVVRARQELRHLSSELVAAQENERRRIARELHDEVGQALWAQLLNLAGVRSALEQRQWDDARTQLDRAQEMGEQNAATVRNMSLLLRPSILDDLGLIPALRWLAREISRTTPLSVDVVAEEIAAHLPDEHKTCVYRVVQEALRNISRHAGANEARIQIEQTANRIRVLVQDDGKGFNAAGEKGVGILGMEERIAALGGTLRMSSEPGRGATLTFELPLPEPFTKQDPYAPHIESVRAEYER